MVEIRPEQSALGVEVPWSLALRSHPSDCSTSPDPSLSLPSHPTRCAELIPSLKAEVVTAPLLCPRSDFELLSDRGQPGAALLAFPSVLAFELDRESSVTEAPYQRAIRKKLLEYNSPLDQASQSSSAQERELSPETAKY